jgi:hypothetical protein
MHARSSQRAGRQAPLAAILALALPLAAAFAILGTACDEESSEGSAIDDAGGDASDVPIGGIPDGPSDDASPVTIDIPTTPRSYRMGVQAHPSGASDDAWAYARTHGDIVAVTLDGGIPWAQLIAGDPLPEALEAELAGIEAQLESTGARLYLSVDLFSPTRTGIAPAYGGAPLPEAIDGASAGERAVVDAYTAYCLELLRRFEPDYFSPVLDLNVYLLNRPSDYAAAVQTYKDVREVLKRERVQTLVFPTWNLEILAGLGPDSDAEQFNEVRLLDANSDRVGLTVSPALQFLEVSALPADHLSRIETLTTRDLVISGASYPSGGFQAGPLIFPSSEASQFNLLAFLLESAEDAKLDFFIWSYPYDLDVHLANLCPGRLQQPNTPCDRAAAFDALLPLRSAGLLAADGTPKTAASLWNDFFARSYVPD